MNEWQLLFVYTLAAVTEEERREAQNSATQQQQQQQQQEEEEETGGKEGNVLRAVLCLLPELNHQELREVRNAAGKMMTQL